MPRRRKITQQQALSALHTLVLFGKQSYKPDANVGLGQCLGMALSKCEITPTQSLTATAELLEDVNYHSLCATVRELAVRTT